MPRPACLLLEPGRGSSPPAHAWCLISQAPPGFAGRLSLSPRRQVVITGEGPRSPAPTSTPVPGGAQRSERLPAPLQGTMLHMQTWARAWAWAWVWAWAWARARAWACQQNCAERGLPADCSRTRVPGRGRRQDGSSSGAEGEEGGVDIASATGHQKRRVAPKIMLR